MTAARSTDSVIIRAYCDDDWPAVCAVHDRARPDELRGSCDPRAFVPLADEQEDAADFQRSRKFVACKGDQVVGFVGVDGTYLSWLYVDPPLAPEAAAQNEAAQAEKSLVRSHLDVSQTTLSSFPQIPGFTLLSAGLQQIL